MVKEKEDALECESCCGKEVGNGEASNFSKAPSPWSTAPSEMHGARSISSGDSNQEHRARRILNCVLDGACSPPPALLDSCPMMSTTLVCEKEWHRFKAPLDCFRPSRSRLPTCSCPSSLSPFNNPSFPPPGRNPLSSYRTDVRQLAGPLSWPVASSSRCS